jgi:hypothetical protein
MTRQTPEGAGVDEIQHVRESVEGLLSDVLLEISSVLGRAEGGAMMAGHGVTFNADPTKDLEGAFSMHRFCWCDSDDCPWCASEAPTAPELADRFARAGAVDGEGAPNFICHETGLKIWWYKYIGRSMKANRRLTMQDIEDLRARFRSWAALPEGRNAIDRVAITEILPVELGALEEPLALGFLEMRIRGRDAQVDAAIADLATLCQSQQDSRLATDLLNRLGAPVECSFLAPCEDPFDGAPRMPLTLSGRISALFERRSKAE